MGGGGMGMDTKQTTKFILTPEAQRAMTAEVGTILNTDAELRGLQSNFMSMMQPGNLASDPTSRNVLNSLGLAGQTVRNAGAQAGLNPRDINRTVADMRTLEPAARGQLQDLAYGISNQVESLVDPRFAFAFKPDQETISEPGAGQEALAYAQALFSIIGLFV